MSKRYEYLCYENYAEPLKEDRPEVVAVKTSEQEAIDFIYFWPGHLWVEKWELGTSKAERGGF